MTKVVNLKNEEYDIYIGRGSKWGNPFTHLSLNGTKAQFQVKTREEAVEEYRRWIIDQPDLMAELPELEGKILGCYCKPAACHGDVLVELLEIRKKDLQEISMPAGKVTNIDVVFDLPIT